MEILHLAAPCRLVPVTFTLDLTMRAMGKSTIAIAGLVVALIASNGWWLYQAIDRGISHTYLEASYSTNTELLKQTVAVLGAGVASGATREQIIRAAQLGDASNQPFEKDGYVWVGQLGLRFNSQGQLSKVAAGPEESSR